MKKITAIVLALVIALSLAVSAFAATSEQEVFPENPRYIREERKTVEIIIEAPEEENPTTGAPVFSAAAGIAVITAAAFVVGKHK